MEDIRPARAYLYKFPLGPKPEAVMENDDINGILDEGYEIADISSCYEKFSHSYNCSVHGISVRSVMITLRPSEKKTAMGFYLVKNDKDACTAINELTAKEAGNGWDLYKIIPINTFMDHRSSIGGGGTKGFALFFLREK